jgi:hypothetical protein
MVRDDENDVVQPELPAEVAEAVLEELRGVHALLSEAEMMARAMADRRPGGCGDG